MFSIGIQRLLFEGADGLDRITLSAGAGVTLVSSGTGSPFSRGQFEALQPVVGFGASWLLLGGRDYLLGFEIYDHIAIDRNDTGNIIGVLIVTQLAWR